MHQHQRSDITNATSLLLCSRTTQLLWQQGAHLNRCLDRPRTPTDFLRLCCSFKLALLCHTYRPLKLPDSWKIQETHCGVLLKVQAYIPYMGKLHRPTSLKPRIYSTYTCIGCSRKSLKSLDILPAIASSGDTERKKRYICDLSGRLMIVIWCQYCHSAACYISSSNDSLEYA